MTRRAIRTPVVLEVGRRRVFASAVDWPGWCRSGKDEQLALEAPAAYAERYRVVTAEAGIEVTVAAGRPDAFEVVERVDGDASTEFGVPGRVVAHDRRPITAAEAAGAAALVAASWRVLERVAAAAPAELRKGPRGGGRDRDAIVAHVVAAEGAAYARKIGLRFPAAATGDADAVAAMRAAVVDTLRGARSGEPLAPKGWPARYAARRIAWHVLDHAWEIEDRAGPAP